MQIPEKVKKRDGSEVPFDSQKITEAVRKAAVEVIQDQKKAKSIAVKVTETVIKNLSAKKIPDIETIQDEVESALMEAGYNKIARAYILYRSDRSRIRKSKSILGLQDDLKLPVNSLMILKNRYLRKDNQQHIIETPREMFRRVAHHVSGAEERLNTEKSSEEVEDTFFNMMEKLKFLPNSPTLMNAGSPLGQLAACFVLPVTDSMDGIFNALHNMARIHQSGGGTGFNFSELRPNGDLVSSTKGEASGPVSFMSIFNKATDVIVQGGKRRGANMGILRCDHPDIEKFIRCKEAGGFKNFNLSVGATDEFMEAVEKNEYFDLINPRTNKKTRKVKAKHLFDLIVNTSWKTGDPGLIFLDEINRKNPTPDIGRIESTNPCGEVPLLAYESCNLGSINLSRMITDDHMDWQKLKKTIHQGIRFLDNVIEVNKYPLPQIRDITFDNRKIGLGVMGFADTLIQLGIPYTSEKALEFSETLMKFIRKESLNASKDLAAERGQFPNIKSSVYAKKKMKIRNAAVNTIAPTGTISIIAGCSSGIEPLFAISYIRNVLSGSRMIEVNPAFEKAAREQGFYSEDLISEIARSGSIQSFQGIPESIKQLFVTAFDVPPEQHLRIQAAFQKYTDNSVSKTINLPPDASLDDVRNIYMMAYKLRCKGITIYRYGSKKEQVLSFGGVQATDTMTNKTVRTGSMDDRGCVEGNCLL